MHQTEHAQLGLEFSDEGLLLTPPPSTQREKEIPGLCLRLIHHAENEVLWIKRGRKGKAMRLIKRFPQKDKEKEVKPGSPPGCAQLMSVILEIAPS